MTTTSAWSRISPRERRLVVGFAFFAELMLGYFLLIDPDLTRISRLQQQADKARVAVAALEATAGPHRAQPAEASAPTVLPALPLPAGEPLDLELQSFLAREVSEAGAKPVAVALPTPAPNASPLPYRSARVSASGPYPAVQQLIERLGKPRYRLGLVSLAVRAESADETQLHVDADLFIEPPQTVAAPSSAPRPDFSPGPGH